MEGNPGDMFPRKQIQASPLVWAVHEPVKVFLPGKVLPWLMFQQKGMISFVSECRITVNCALTMTGVEFVRSSFVSIKLGINNCLKSERSFVVNIFFYCGIHFYIVKCSHLAYKSVSTDK